MLNYESAQAEIFNFPKYCDLRPKYHRNLVCSSSLFIVYNYNIIYNKEEILPGSYPWPDWRVTFKCLQASMRDPMRCDWLIRGGAGLSPHLSPPLSAVCASSGGEEGRCLRAFASVKVEEGERSSWRLASSTRAASRWKQVRFLPLIAAHLRVNQSSDGFMSLSPGVAPHPCTCTASSSIL